MERLHPNTMQTLRELVRLHGADRLILTIRQIEKEPVPRMTIELSIPETAAERVQKDMKQVRD